MGTAIAEVASGSNLLVCFRTAYLKAIARAWVDDNYRDTLYSGLNVLSWSGFLKFLPGNEKYYVDDLSQDADGNWIFAYAANPDGGTYTDEDVRKLPWSAKVTVLDNDEGPIYEPTITAGWMGPNDKFIVVIPPAPENEEDFPAALASYLQQFPTLLGYDEENKHEEWEFDAGEAHFLSFSNVLAQAISLCWAGDEKIVDVRKEMSLLNLKDLLAGSNKADDNLDDVENLINGSGYKASSEMEDQPFYKLFITHDLEQIKNTDKLELVEQDGNGLEMLSSYYGYNNPWNFDFWMVDAGTAPDSLTISDVKDWKSLAYDVKAFYQKTTNDSGDTVYVFNKVKWNTDEQKWDGLFNVVNLNLPQNPLNNIQDENSKKMVQVVKAQALAVYNRSAAHYPFTCA